jgi:signal transduction histidine kinase/CheY-like chemotaxis protein
MEQGRTMLSRLKLWQKIVIITAILGLPLLLVTREYVKLSKELSLNNLKQQLTALPALEHIGELTRQIQDHGANLPLWVIGSDISPNHMRESFEKIDGMVERITIDLSHIKGFDQSQWLKIAEKIKGLHEGGDATPRGFSVYAELSSELTNFAKNLSYSAKFYSGAGNIIVTSRMAVDLTPSLAENVNLLRGYITYKTFINEKTIDDLSATSSYLSLAENRYREIEQSLNDIRTTSPELFRDMESSASKIDVQFEVVRGLVKQYHSEGAARVQPEQFFTFSTELIGSIYDLHNISIRLMETKLRQEIRAAEDQVNYIISIASFAGLIVLALIFFISRSFVRGVRDVVIITQQVAAGNRQIYFPPQEGNDEIRSIMDELRRTYLAICESEERARIDTWLLERQKALNETIRGEKDLKRFAENCLSSLGGSIGAEIGSFYRQSEGALDLVYSLGVKAPLHFDRGEGLISAVASAGQIRHLSQEMLPDGYSSISSSLGQSFAKGLIIFPVRFQNEVIAVLEFLSFNDFNDISLRFLEAVEENIAVILKSVEANALVLDLLGTTQKQSSELLEANLELETKTQLLNDQQLTLQQVNQELEEQRSELEAQNEKLEVVIDNLAIAKKDAEEKGREAEVANRYKSIFLANMSHELRTPLNSIMILAQVLVENREKTMSENQIKNANIIHTSGKDLLKLINEILDLSRIEAGKIEINPVAIDVGVLASDTLEMYEALAHNKKLSYSVAVEPDCPKSLISDPVRLAQILRNFVANAIKFTEAGLVSVKFKRAESALYALEVDVKDSGVGIPTDKQAVIFEPFRQLNNALSRKEEGTGLGLAISKNLAAKLGGDILVSSEPGKGSTFTLLLPLQPPDENGSAGELKIEDKIFVEDDRDNVKPHEATVLIIEDDQTFAELLLAKCRAEGFKCVLSPRGRDCVGFAERFFPHGILLDLRLPDMDGLDVLTDLKSNAKTRNIPVHVFSGADGETEAMKRGAKEFVSKPISMEKLEQVLKDLPSEAILDDISLFLHSVDSKMPKSKGPSNALLLNENVFEGKSILIVDDDIRNVYSLRQILHGRGSSILVAENGREALEVLAEHPATDLVLMDIMMPEMDGYEATRRIREEERFKKLPIIALTAKAMKDDRDKCIAAGASDYLLKPIDTDKLLMLMRVWLGK